MAQLITVRLSRNDGCAWGFRLQGGKDFGTPLVIQKVNGGSPAEKAGLIAGDAVVKVNTTDVFNLRHKDAQDVIVRAGQSFEMTVQRGGSTWKPAVTPVGNLPRSQPLANNVSPVTKTSLAAKNQSYTPIGAAHNLSPKGFSSAPHMNGDGPKLVNKQYNSPIGIYSEDSIAETLSAQAEVLSTGALGVNFKKNEKTYNADKSEVLKMLQEVEKEPRSPEPARHDIYSTMSHAIGGRATSPRPMTPLPPHQQHQIRNDTGAVPTNESQSQENPICSECERLIVGVFVRIKDKNLHVECFKCATCGSSLKNVGYYNINNKLYCDIHAKLAARSNPPAPNMVPVTIPPGGKAPLGTISAALASHSLPSPSPLSPSGNQVAAPFQNSKQDNLEIRTTPNSILKKEDAVANLMSALTMASQKEVKENGTNTEPCYLSEKIIPVNNNHINNNGSSITTDQQYPSATIKYMPYRPMTGSSLSGPRPFSSVQPSTPTHAPVAPPLSSTLPRSASSNTMPERKEWPPSKPNEEIPTACPLYISPSTRIPTPQLISNPPIQNNPPPPPPPPPQNPHPEVFIPQEQKPHSLMTNPYHQTSQIPVLQNLNPQIYIQNPIQQNNPTKIPVSQMSNPYNPSPQIVISQNTSQQNLAQQNPNPRNPDSCNPNIYNPNPQNPTSVVSTIDTNLSNSQSQDISYECNTSSHSTLQHQASICSAEVTNITGCRSTMECVETISDSIDTQILVNKLTQQRPKSPPPIHRKDSVLDIQDNTNAYETQDISVIVTAKQPDKKYKTGAPIITVEETNKTVNIEDTSAVCGRVCRNNPGPKSCPMNNPECEVNVNVYCPQNTQECPLNQQTSQPVEFTTSLVNTIPKEYISPMVKALTVASDRPFNSVAVTIKSKEYDRKDADMSVSQTQKIQKSQQMHETRTQEMKMHETKTMQENKSIHETKSRQQAKSTQEVKSKQETKSLQEAKSMQSKKMKSVETKFPHQKAPHAVSPLASALTIAPTVPFTPAINTNLEPVSLPEETVPYFPPEHPIEIEPKVEKPPPPSCKSPFVQALTTAPTRPYSPMVSGFGTSQEQKSDVSDFMKDVPKPGKQKMSMLAALTTASERSFTPALSVCSLGDNQEIREQIQIPVPSLKPEPKKIESPAPLTVKPASHMIPSPSAFRPIGSIAKSFQPVPQTTQFQRQDVSKQAPSIQSISKPSYAPTNSYTNPAQPDYLYQPTQMSQYSQQQIPQVQVSQTHYSQQQQQHQQQQQLLQQQQQQQLQQQQQQHQQQQQLLQQQQQQQLKQQQQQQQRQQQQQLSQTQYSQQQMQQYSQQQYSQQQAMESQYSQQDQYSNISRKEDIHKEQAAAVYGGSGLKASTSIPSYQKNLQEKLSEEEQIYLAPPTIQQPVQPIQKPVTTLKPGQYGPKTWDASFQPVSDDKNYLRTNSPMLRPISPSLINKPAPAMPYYQADIVAHECAPIQSSLLDPTSPAVSRSPSPMPGRSGRSSSPFPRQVAKSPAPGPPPNPLADRYPKPQIIRDEKYLEAKENLTTCIPKYQSRVEQIKKELTTEQRGQKQTTMGQSQMSAHQLQVSSGQSALGGQYRSTAQSDTYQNMQIAQRTNQQQAQNYRMSEVENMRHMEQVNKSQIQSTETSADNRIQIQRTKRVQEEYERTQKSKTIEIQRGATSSQFTQQQQQQQQISQNGSYSFGTTGFQKPLPNQPNPSRIPQKSTPVPISGPAPSQPRSFSLPSATAALGPKPFKPSPLASGPSKIPASGPSRVPLSNQSASTRPNMSQPNAGAATGRQTGAIGVAPKRGRGILNLAAGPGSRVPLCGHCNSHIRGPFITALGKIWCPEHFVCTTPTCKRPLQDMGFVEERGQLYCEYCFEQYLAPICAKCNSKIKGDCLNAIGKHFHPECFTCAYCSKLFGNSPFFLEDGLPYCEADWNELFTTKCFACGFPVEAGDRWVEALNNNYHSQCFNCTMCKKNLEGQSFYAKGGRPFCKNHAR